MPFLHSIFVQRGKLYGTTYSQFTSGNSFTHAQYTDNMVITLAHSSRCSSSFFLDNIYTRRKVYMQFLTRPKSPKQLDQIYRWTICTLPIASSHCKSSYCYTFLQGIDPLLMIREGFKIWKTIMEWPGEGLAAACPLDAALSVFAELEPWAQQQIG